MKTTRMIRVGHVLVAGTSRDLGLLGQPVLPYASAISVRPPSFVYKSFQNSLKHFAVIVWGCNSIPSSYAW